MMVITVSRSYGSAGSLFARRIADTLGFVYADEAFINKIGRDPEVSEALLMSLEDEPSPSLLQRSKDLLSRKSFYKLALSACIYDFALKHDIVFVGGGAHIILEHYPGLLSIQVVRNMSDRIRDIAADKYISYEEALDLIEQKDRAKNKFISYYFDSDLFDPLKFHITFNASLISLNDALTFSAGFAKKHFSEVNREEAQTFLRKKLLEKKAEILLAGRDIAGDFGKVAFEATGLDTLLVKGVIGSEEKKKRLLKALWNLKDLKKVEDQLRVGVLSRLIY
ncbi:MAG: cytidylate kinase-like family protein [Syntrophorhabdaceae bacterium]|nr:cytidylate kinase-like family protein [Syntrophorhabdaceae bacterium]